MLDGDTDPGFTGVIQTLRLCQRVIAFGLFIYTTVPIGMILRYRFIGAISPDNDTAHETKKLACRTRQAMLFEDPEVMYRTGNGL